MQREEVYRKWVLSIGKGITVFPYRERGEHLRLGKGKGAGLQASKKKAGGTGIEKGDGQKKQTGRWTNRGGEEGLKRRIEFY